MEEIKENEYVRNIYGTIGKCIKTTYDFDDGLYNDEYITVEPTYKGTLNIKQSMYKNDITKHSFDKLEMLEVKDVIRFLELSESNCTELGHIYVVDIHDEEELEQVKNQVRNNKIRLLNVLSLNNFLTSCYDWGE